LNAACAASRVGWRPGANVGFARRAGELETGRELSVLLRAVTSDWTAAPEDRQKSIHIDRSCARNCRTKPSAGIRRGWH
jgi:hypothetical protein